ncbi:recombinase family protein [Candidatus Omnitrophota bacterium]
MEGMIEVIDEFYSAVLGQETLRGLIENTRKGYRNGGYATFGYKNVHVYDDNKNQRTRYEINEPEATTARLIFELYTKGNGLKNIVTYLNTHDHKPRSGGNWSKSTVANVLRNESYIGWTVFNKRDKKTYGKQFKPKDQWIIIKNTHEPIISEDLFNKAQRLIEKRQPKHQPARVTSSTYLLSGLMRCSKCGSTYGVTGYGRDRKYAYYNCITYSKQGKSVCAGHRVRADELDKKVIDRVKILLFSDENMKKLTNDINQAAKFLRTDYWKKITDLKKKASDLQNRVMRQYEAIESGVIDISLVAPRLKELKTQRESLHKEITYYENLNNRHQPIHISRATIDGFRKEMEEIFVGNNIQEKREFLKKFIEKIIIKEDKIEIVYYAPGAMFPS